MTFSLQVKNWHLFLAITSFYLILVCISNAFIITDNIYYNTLSNKIPIEEINRLLSFQKDYSWVSYLVQIVALLIKVYFTAGCIFIGLFLGEAKLKFNKIVKVVLLSEVVFMLYGGIRLVLIYTGDFSTLDQIQHFWPLSLFSLFPPESIPAWLFYPLYLVNIAEVAYWALLAWGISFLVKANFFSNLKTVLSSYGSGLLLWIVMFVFVQLYFLNP